jgi:LacI family transcriptional regulator
MAKRSPSGKVDIRRVAEEASVSIATVSRVVSGRGPVTDTTRARVERAVKRLGYRPSASARSLRTSRSMIIGILLPDLANPVFVPFLRGVQRVAQAEGYSVLVVDAQRRADVERLALDRLAEQRVDGLVLAGAARDPSRIEELRKVGMQIVARSDRIVDPEHGVDDLEAPGTLAMCTSLAELGHRRIAFVSRGDMLGDAGDRRLELIALSCRSLGINVEQVTVDPGANAGDVGREISAVVRRHSPVSALVCSTHGLAPTLLGAIGAAQIVVPRECSFVTYGDSEWAVAYRPAISVITMDLFAIASALTRRLIGALRGVPEIDVAHEPARFVIRDSVGAAPS